MLQNKILKSSYFCLGIRDGGNHQVLSFILSHLEDLTNKIIQGFFFLFFFCPSFKYKYMIRKTLFLQRTLPMGLILSLLQSQAPEPFFKKNLMKMPLKEQESPFHID